MFSSTPMTMIYYGFSTSDIMIYHGFSTSDITKSDFT